MKITIELQDHEVKGIKNYLKETEGISRRINKQDVQDFIRSEANVWFDSGSLGEHIATEYFKAKERGEAI